MGKHCCYQVTENKQNTKALFPNDRRCKAPRCVYVCVLDACGMRKRKQTKMQRKKQPKIGHVTCDKGASWHHTVTKVPRWMTEFGFAPISISSKTSQTDGDPREQEYTRVSICHSAGQTHQQQQKDEEKKGPTSYCCSAPTTRAASHCTGLQCPTGTARLPPRCDTFPLPE